MEGIRSNSGFAAVYERHLFRQVAVNLHAAEEARTTIVPRCRHIPVVVLRTLPPSMTKDSDRRS